MMHCFTRPVHHLDLPSFPTRRSSDLENLPRGPRSGHAARFAECSLFLELESQRSLDRKSTRLNSSHVENSYAVFCLKKKTAARDREHVFHRHQEGLVGYAHRLRDVGV